MWPRRKQLQARDAGQHAEGDAGLSERAFHPFRAGKEAAVAAEEPAAPAAAEEPKAEAPTEG